MPVKSLTSATIPIISLVLYFQITFSELYEFSSYHLTQSHQTFAVCRRGYRGVTPTSPTFINAGPIQEFTPNTETNAVNYRMLGSPDLYKVIKTGERFSFDITYNPIDLDLVSYGVNLSGTKNRDKTLTFLLSQSMYPGTGAVLTEHYIKAVGCSCDSTSIDISLEAVSVSQTWIANDIPIPTVTPGIGTSSLC